MAWIQWWARCWPLILSFTGSTRAGKRVSELASQTIKSVAHELGGKSASVILSSANFEAAVKGTVGACMINSGQTCLAHTRMLVPAARHEEVKALAQAAISKFSVGPSLNEASKLAPLVSATQRDRVLELIKTGIAEGADIIAGGADASALAAGYFVRPTVLCINPPTHWRRKKFLARYWLLFPTKTKRMQSQKPTILFMVWAARFGPVQMKRLC